MEHNRNYPLFEDSVAPHSGYFESGSIPIERLNQLFQNDSITSEEHLFLLRKLYPTERRISRLALASLLIGALAWVLLIKVTMYGQEFSLLPGRGRLIAGVVLAPLAFLLSYLARKEIREKENVKGSDIVVAGLTLSIALLTIAVPSFLLWLFDI